MRCCTPPGRHLATPTRNQVEFAGAMSGPGHTCRCSLKHERATGSSQLTGAPVALKRREESLQVKLHDNVRQIDYVCCHWRS